MLMHNSIGALLTTPYPLRFLQLHSSPTPVQRDDVVSLLHTNAALNAAWTTGCVVHVANVDDGPSVLRDAYTPELCLISDATLSSSLASTLTTLLLRGEGREEILLAHTLCHGTTHEGGGVDVPLATFLTSMAASHWTWTASRLHKTEHIYSVADRGTQPRKESISSPFCGPSDVSLLPCGVLPLLPEGVMGGTAVPLPTSSAAATTTQPSSPRTLLSEHVEALPLDTELGPRERTETLHGAAIKPTPEECVWCVGVGVKDLSHVPHTPLHPAPQSQAPTRVHRCPPPAPRDGTTLPRHCDGRVAPSRDDGAGGDARRGCACGHHCAPALPPWWGVVKLQYDHDSCG